MLLNGTSETDQVQLPHVSAQDLLARKEQQFASLAAEGLDFVEIVQVNAPYKANMGSQFPMMAGALQAHEGDHDLAAESESLLRFNE